MEMWWKTEDVNPQRQGPSPMSLLYCDPMKMIDINVSVKEKYDKTSVNFCQVWCHRTLCRKPPKPRKPSLLRREIYFINYCWLDSFKMARAQYNSKHQGEQTPCSRSDQWESSPLQHSVLANQGPANRPRHHRLSCFS